MCGRFPGVAKARVVQLLDALRRPYRDRTGGDRAVNYQTAPTEHALALIAADDAQIELTDVAWGWRPPWLRSGVLRLARSEEAAAKPTFADAWRRRRCLVAAAGFYDWRQDGGGVKVPFLFRARDRDAVLLAALWSDEPRADGGTERRVALLTTRANALVEPVIDRMPVIVAPDDALAWLAAATPAADLARACAPVPAEALTCHPVSSRVGRAGHNDPQLMEPIG